VAGFDGLLINFARAKGAQAIIRGLRAVADFDYEFQMALTNRKLEPEIEIVYFLPAESFFYISSSLVKELATLGGDITEFVPEPVAKALKERCRR
jgi:pantetheine-phosphate adenylyltransferase